MCAIVICILHWDNIAQCNLSMLCIYTVVLYIVLQARLQYLPYVSLEPWFLTLSFIICHRFNELTASDRRTGTFWVPLCKSASFPDSSCSVLRLQMEKCWAEERDHLVNLFFSDTGQTDQLLSFIRGLNSTKPKCRNRQRLNLKTGLKNKLKVADWQSEPGWCRTGGKTCELGWSLPGKRSKQMRDNLWVGGCWRRKLQQTVCQI